MAADGRDALGGQTLDARILAWIRKRLETDDPVLAAEIRAPGATAASLTLKDRIRRAKEALLEAPVAATVIPAVSGNKVLQLTRDEFDQPISSDIDSAVVLTKDTLAKANSSRTVTDPVTMYLMGGSSKSLWCTPAFTPCGH